MLAKNVNDNAPLLTERGALEFIASKLAPTIPAHTDSTRRKGRDIANDALRQSANVEALHTPIAAVGDRPRMVFI